VFGAEYFLVGFVGQSAQSCDFFAAKMATILSLLLLRPKLVCAGQRIGQLVLEMYPNEGGVQSAHQKTAP
jgi:hypothetical protein